MMNVQQRDLFRGILFHYVLMCLAFAGICGLNRGLVRNLLAMTAATVVLGAMAFFFLGRRKGGGNCLVGR